ncbi:Crp/Fnr family transcriptional regulator [Candidatus Nitrospira bockiana]
MPRQPPAHIGARNRLLTALAARGGTRFFHYLEPVPLHQNVILYEQGDPIKHVYFPTTAVVSMISVMEDGASVEIASIGNEGVAGISVFLGVDLAVAKAVVQAPGEALRIDADLFKAESVPVGPLHTLLTQYTHALLTQISRSGACNSLHSAQKRFARWLLTMQDRARTNQFLFTQEFLSEMLGVRRPSVSFVMRKLQKAGLILYARKKITIIDRDGLQAVSCECYKILKEEYDRVFADAAK